MLDANYYRENFYPGSDPIYESKFKQKQKSHIVVAEKNKMPAFTKDTEPQQPDNIDFESSDRSDYEMEEEFITYLNEKNY